ncbi:phosphatidate cytidylyltransferase, mitochondrial [Anthonomus grandis grandis]|uniref:phosphatidate cytidylyltransferase, mitochondrial n=1 Tax=Anthonomus grandis grandis TaxID=2921223 RepID=UPI002165FC31|nr:phosphatidate cytidylyltransferase, mitochondrial [Anthonomus grandis grandis]
MTSGIIPTLPTVYNRILTKFPQNITFCFAYGSGVKKQLNNDTKQNMIDLIFAVKDPVTWHETNLRINPSHYSGLKFFGHEFIARYQINIGAKVYYNTLVQVDESLVKYGVVSTEDLITDLLEWSQLYLAGRLHKPVEIIQNPLDADLETALQLNLQSAVHAALLVLPESFSEYEFYHTICNLSYLGDFRMIFGENKNKVDSIVRAQMSGFRKLYKPFLLNLHDYIDFPMLKEDNCDPSVYCAQDLSPLARLHHLNQLPRLPQKLLTRYWNKGNFRQDTEDVLRAIAYDPDCGMIVSQRINEIVWKSSVRQSLKGILTAGVFKSLQYSSRKIKKMFKS